MKFRRILYLVLGIICVLYNLLVCFVHYVKHASPPQDDLPFQIGWYIGNCLLFVLGAIFFRAAYRLGKKIKSKVLIQEFLKDEIQQNSVR